jgi:hypothetical protein
MREPFCPIAYLREVIPHTDWQQLKALSEKIHCDKDSYVANEYLEMLGLLDKRLMKLNGSHLMFKKKDK